jgi:hydroxymethylbilane synthase
MSLATQERLSFDIGTRKSKLALLQTDIVVKALNEAWPEHKFNVRARDTAAGDLDKVTPFKDMPVKNLWTHDLEQSLVEENLDLLVHSLKGKPCSIDSSSRSSYEKMFLRNCRQIVGLEQSWTVEIPETPSS